MENKKQKIKKTLVTLGAINLLHAGLHLFQFFQSLLLVNQSINDNDHGIIHTMTHSPYFAFIWAILGIFTLWVGIRDYKHHNECKDDHIDIG